MEIKNYKGLVWLVVILIVLVVALMGFIIYREFYGEEKPSVDNATNSTTSKVNTDETILEEESIAYSLNNKQHNIKFEYKTIEDNENHNKYGVYVNIYLDNKKVTKEGYPIFYTDSKDDIKNYKNLKLTKNNIDLIFNDKDYLVLYFDSAQPTYLPNQILLLINENGELLESINLGVVGYILEDESINKFYNGKKYYIKNNELYYLKKFSDEECEQWIITINDDNVEVLSQGYLVLKSIAGAE